MSGPAATPQLVADQRRGALPALAAQLGNRRFARLALARTPAPQAPGLPAVNQAAADVLTKLGLSEAQIAAFRAGEPVLFNLVVPGFDATICVIQLRPGLVRGGIFSINVPKDEELATKAFFAARQRVLNVARALRLSEYELLGAAVHNDKIERMLVRLEFTRTTEVLPESLGLGPNAECDIFSKRFPVHGGAGGTPSAGGPEAPPATSSASPSTPATSTAEEEVAGATSRAAGRTASEVGGKAAADAVAGGLGFWETMGLTFAVSLIFDAAVGWMTYEKNVGDPKALKFAGFLHDKLNLGLMQGIQAHVKEARQMAIDRPDLPVYALLTYDLDYHWTGDSSGAAAISGQDLDYRDARVVAVEVGRRHVSSDVVLSRAGAGDLRRRTDTRRVTLSLELNPLGETAERRHRRVLYREAGQAASRGLSARSVVEHSHVDIQLTPAEEREEHQRARVGLPSVRDERERQEQLMWVAAYLDYTSIYGPQTLYDDAVAYYRELERRPLPSLFPQPGVRSGVPRGGPVRERT